MLCYTKITQCWRVVHGKLEISINSVKLLVRHDLMTGWVFSFIVCSILHQYRISQALLHHSKRRACEAGASHIPGMVKYYCHSERRNLSNNSACFKQIFHCVQYDKGYSLRSRRFAIGLTHKIDFTLMK